MTSDVNLDLEREQRVGFGEAVLSDAKSVDQLVAVLRQADEAGVSMLMTRLSSHQVAAIPPPHQARLDFDKVSRTAFYGPPATLTGSGQVAVVTAGTSDTPVAREAVRTLAFNGHEALEISDVGVAGLWRLQMRMADIRDCHIVIAVAGMDGALPTVVAGLVPSLVIGVPTSVGYGIAEGGVTAMRSLLTSCAPGLVVVNIDNGYGAACAAMRALRRRDTGAELDRPARGDVALEHGAQK